MQQDQKAIKVKLAQPVPPELQAQQDQKVTKVPLVLQVRPELKAIKVKLEQQAQLVPKVKMASHHWLKS